MPLIETDDSFGIETSGICKAHFAASANETEILAYCGKTFKQSDTINPYNWDDNVLCDGCRAKVLE